ncbi:MAG: hypothetical protein ACK5AM_07470, partial [Pirellulaceae bacterium]
NVREKKTRDLVTDADIQAQQLIAGFLFPDIRRVSHLLNLSASLDSGRLGDEKELIQLVVIEELRHEFSR